MFKFEILHQSKKSEARVGRVTTKHGSFLTPAFVAVGTNGVLKAVDHVSIAELALPLVFANTYHLMLHPGADTIEKAGGIHQFSGRTGPIITDSGGFQVFSLAYGSVANELKSKGKKKHGNSVLSITEEGVVFRSYRDGAKITLTPESSIEAQKKIGADIIIPFDELPPYHMDEPALQRSLNRTHRWEKRSLDAHLANPKHQAIYAVCHGGVNPDYRKESARYLSSLPFDGFGIGGSLGKNRQELAFVLENTIGHLRPEAPRHLLGIGDIPSITDSVPAGIDTFDSSYPTKAARHAVAFHPDEPVRLKSTKHRESFEPIEQGCPCFTCKHYTKAWLHHLFKAHEATAHSLTTIHNLSYMTRLMTHYQSLILSDQM
ncbi:tRNA guanosine(34) transglycosylase Tgt [Candidatus Synchoanobacter obligatus]|uniref:tRNA-guanosine(34) transglycosylase n=1 Tax=Candidatus Synchoanobacter obligatus TaxID=2919597 RepID=A0ABT1L3X1_9GAMM|nr:tRNA-guanosine(34) transglycosylase [Candidatus Synchoanobacter obligatus]